MSDPKRFLKLSVCLALMGLAGLSASGHAAEPAKDQTREQKQAAQMNAVYGEHLAMSLCKSEYGAKFMPGSLKPADRKQLDAHVGSACSCLHKELAKTATPPEIVDYIMYIYGASENPMKPSQARTSYMASQKFLAVGKVFTDKAVRKKCGFIK